MQRGYPALRTLCPKWARPMLLGLLGPEPTHDSYSTQRHRPRMDCCCLDVGVGSDENWLLANDPGPGMNHLNEKRLYILNKYEKRRYLVNTKDNM